MSTLALTSSPGAAGLFARSWWVLLFRGLLAIALGLFALTWPTVTLAAVVLTFAVYAFVEGFAALIAAIRGWSHGDTRLLLVLEAAIGIGVGIITLRTPLITAKALVLLIAIWALATGVVRIVEGVRLRREITGELWLIIGGLVSLAFGLLILFRPLVGAFAIVQVIGIYALILGLTEVLLSFRVRSLRGAARTAIQDAARRRRLDTEVLDENLDFERKELHK